jgi:membrane protein implicated in regulation of membrane protease activity
LIPVADAVFVVVALVGLVPLLVMVVFPERVGHVLDGLDVTVDTARTPVTLLLGFVSLFGIGGLVATHLLAIGGRQAVLAGLITGIAGAILVWRVFPVLRESNGPSPISVRDLVGRDASVAVAIPAGKFGSIYVKAAGGIHEYSATASADIAVGTTVTVTGALGNGLVVAAIEAPKTGSLL